MVPADTPTLYKLTGSYRYLEDKQAETQARSPELNEPDSESAQHAVDNATGLASNAAARNLAQLGKVIRSIALEAKHASPYETGVGRVGRTR